MLKPSPYQLLSFKLLPVAAISALGLSFAAQLPTSAATLISDGDFTNWDTFHFITDNPFQTGPAANLSTGSGQRLETGGLPDAFLQLSHSIVLGDTSWVGGIKTDVTYNPVTDGEILSLSVAANVRSASSSSAWQVVVEQAGQRYFSFPFQVTSVGLGDWKSVSLANLTSEQFDTNPWADSAGLAEPPDGNRPNFGAGASPLRFGFMFGNRSIGGTAQNTFWLDNFSLTIESGEPVSNPVVVPDPDPAAWLTDKTSELAAKQGV
jgi:hypothetical protein